MSKRRDKIDVPNPERKIGETSDGKPVFLDIRELLSDPDEDSQRVAATIENRRKKLINDVAELVIKNGIIFIESTFMNVANQTGKRLYESGNAAGAYAWVSANGFEAIQDGLKTVVKHNGKVIRDMHAKIPVGLAEAVAKRVSEIVKQQPMMK